MAQQWCQLSPISVSAEYIRTNECKGDAAGILCPDGLPRSYNNQHLLIVLPAGQGKQSPSLARSLSE